MHNQRKSSTLAMSDPNKTQQPAWPVLQNVMASVNARQCMPNLTKRLIKELLYVKQTPEDAVVGHVQNKVKSVYTVH
jgi:hypothetical protein